MAQFGVGYTDPLKRVMPRTGVVQNTNSLVPNTAPISSRPVAPPAVRTGTPGPVAAPVPALGGTPGFKAPAVGQVPAPPIPNVTPQQPAQMPVSAPPAPAPAPAAPSLYGAGGGGAPDLETQLRGYITGALGGVTSDQYVNRARQNLAQSVSGQTTQAQRRSDEDLIRRGLFRSGLGPEQSAAIEVGAQNVLSQGINDILNQAEQQDIAGRESAAGTAGNLLSANRSWDQYQQQRADEQAARAAANRQEDTSFTYVDPDTGQSYEMDESWF